MTTLGLVAIVKDEAPRIGRMLESAAPYLTAATIVDTGSADETPAIVQSFGWQSVSRPWVDFGTNRSEALELALGTADWLIALDADMTIRIDPGFEPDPDVDAYMVELPSADGAYRLPLLLRGDRRWRSVGACHEYTILAEGSLGRREVTDAVHVGHDPGPRPGKLERDRGLLRAELERDPANVRATYYLAQTHRNLGDRAIARELYLRRAAMGGWEEERWHAQYQAALLTEPWGDRLPALLAAWEARPARLEPLYHAITGLRERGCSRAAAALQPADLTPPADILFVERWIWDELA